MSDHKKPEKKSKPPQALGWMAEYADENQLLDAARKVRDSGYTRTDAFTPFPVHGIDEALGIKATVLPWFTLCAGFTGITIALTMQWWMNAVDYPYIISGKPFASWPAFIPVAFELTVLFSAFTTVFAMLGLNGLPRFSNPVFTNPKFDRTTDDRFFLWVDSRDKYFNSDKVKGLLESTEPLEIEEVREDASSDEIPKGIIVTILTLILITLIPGSIVLNMRNAKSGQPRWHVFFDMDFQPARKTQTPTTIFADRRVQRPPVPGTVARGELGLSDPYNLGYDPSQTAVANPAADSMKFISWLQNSQVAAPDEGSAPVPADQPVAEGSVESDAQGSTPAAPQSDVSATSGQEGPASEPPADPAAGEPNLPWIAEFPLPLDNSLYELGRKKYEQNCAVCHGFGGYGDGLVSQRAMNLAQGYWLQPTSLHEERIQQQPVGRIYYTVTNGKGKMGSYAASLNPRERWAVVFYVRALQRSQNAQQGDIAEGANLTAVGAE
jgi:mono/diheme cytochrome c family protein